MIIHIDHLGFTTLRLRRQNSSITEVVSDIFVELSESLDNQTVVSAFHVFNRMDLLQLPVALKTLRQSGFDCPEITQQIWDEARKACTQVGDLVLEIPE